MSSDEQIPEEQRSQLEVRLAGAFSRSSEEIAEAMAQGATPGEDALLERFRAQIPVQTAPAGPRLSPWSRSALAVAALLLGVLTVVLSTSPGPRADRQTLGPAPRDGEVTVERYDGLTWNDELAPAAWYRLEFFEVGPDADVAPLHVVQDWESSSWKAPEAGTESWPDAVRLRVTEVDPTGIEQVVLERRYLRSR